MDILDGTNTNGPILLGFTRAEFDQLCQQLRSDGPGCTEWDDSACGSVLRVRGCFVEHPASEQPSRLLLRADAALIAQMLRLGPLGAEITGARFDAEAQAVVFDVAVPDAPAGATEMTPVYRREYPSERHVMVDPGFGALGSALPASGTGETHRS